MVVHYLLLLSLAFVNFNNEWNMSFTPYRDNEGPIYVEELATGDANAI